MAHQRHGSGARQIILRGEEATSRGPHAERRERARGDPGSFHRDARPLGLEQEARLAVGAEIAEHLLLIAPVGVVGRGGVHDPHPGLQILLPDHDQPVGLLVGERAEQDGVHGREDRARRPDSESERKGGGHGKTGVAPQQPGAVPKVPPEPLHPVPPFRVFERSEKAGEG